MGIPVRRHNQGFPEGGCVFAHEHDRRTVGREARGHLGTVGHCCAQRTQRVGSS